jgi:hypothetical protein
LIRLPAKLPSLPRAHHIATGEVVMRGLYVPWWVQVKHVAVAAVAASLAAGGTAAVFRLPALPRHDGRGGKDFADIDAWIVLAVGFAICPAGWHVPPELGAVP